MSTQTVTQCMATVRSDGFWSARCSRGATHTVTVKTDEQGEKTEEVHVCGTHKNVLERGEFLFVESRGMRHGRTVYGIKTDINKAKEAVERAESAVAHHKGQTRYMAERFGRSLYNMMDEIAPLIEHVTDERVRDELQGMVESRRRYQQHEVELLDALQAAKDALAVLTKEGTA